MEPTAANPQFRASAEPRQIIKHTVHSIWPLDALELP